MAVVILKPAQLDTVLIAIRVNCGWFRMKVPLRKVMADPEPSGANRRLARRRRIKAGNCSGREGRRTKSSERGKANSHHPSRWWYHSDRGASGSGGVNRPFLPFTSPIPQVLTGAYASSSATSPTDHPRSHARARASTSASTPSSAMPLLIPALVAYAPQHTRLTDPIPV